MKAGASPHARDGGADLFLNGGPEALACIISIDAVMGLFIGVVNCFGTMVSTVTVSHREQLLDVARYNDVP